MKNSRKLVGIFIITVVLTASLIAIACDHGFASGVGGDTSPGVNTGGTNTGSNPGGANLGSNPGDTNPNPGDTNPSANPFVGTWVQTYLYTQFTFTEKITFTKTDWECQLIIALTDTQKIFETRRYVGTYYMTGNNQAMVVEKYDGLTYTYTAITNGNNLLIDWGGYGSLCEYTRQ